MKTDNERITEWIIGKIKSKYSQDVKLLLGDDVYKLDIDRPHRAMGYYFPASENANKLGKTFIIDGIGYDLFPMSWERMENIADLNEDNAPVILDARVLYSTSEEERERFLALQRRLRDHLNDPQYSRQKALEKVSIAMELYQTMAFEDTLYKVRKAAGHIIIYLSHAVAYSNRTCFRRGHNEQIADLAKMPHLPVDFVKLIGAIIAAPSIPEITNLCHQLIKNTRQFFSTGNSAEIPIHNCNYQELAGWYHELSYAWREVYHWCEQKEAAKAFIRGSFLQSELDVVQAEFGLPEMDLLGAFDAVNLADFRKRAQVLEDQIINTIKEHGASLDSYSSVEEFLTRNN